VTLSGGQHDSEQFFRSPIVDGCSLHMEGTLREGWAFNRSNSITMEFTKYGHTVLLQRTGRVIGDTAFSTKGELRRDATGFMKIMGPTGCLTFNLPDPICGQTVKAPLDLRLDYAKGTLSLKGSGPSAQVPNPLEKCGLVPEGGSSFNQLTNPYPHLLKQKASLSSRKIFGNRKKFGITVKAKFLEPKDEHGYTTFSEKLSGDTSLIFERK
jgi:hypothetical protein